MKNILDAFKKRSAQRRTLTHLQKLDAHLLRDIGLTHTDLAIMLNGVNR
jgi:uncharacterized protein YjiS (DUF1127 family)